MGKGGSVEVDKEHDTVERNVLLFPTLEPSQVYYSPWYLVLADIAILFADCLPN